MSTFAVKCAYCGAWWCDVCWKCERPICKQHAVEAGLDEMKNGMMRMGHQCAEGLECDSEEDDHGNVEARP